MNHVPTQTQLVKAYLRRFGQIDPMVAWKRLGIYRLGARIYDLRKAGLDIKTTRKRTRGGAQIAVYKLAS